MNASYLAQQLLKWEQLRRSLDELEAAIRDGVLQLGKTQTVGNVRASYSTGCKKYDYATAFRALKLPPDAIDPFQRLTRSTDWRAACGAHGVEDVPFTQGTPSVSIKPIK